MGFYGEPETSLVIRTWNLLRNIKPNALVPWMVMGDLNEILYHSEKVRGRERSENLMNNFRQTLEMCSLYDFSYSGDPFNLSNKHESSSFTKERLDQTVVNQEWSRIFNDVKVETLVARCLDHKPLLACCGHLGTGLKRRAKLFRYETWWDLEKSFKERVDQLWRSHGVSLNSVNRVLELLLQCQQRLKQWSVGLYRER